MKQILWKFDPLGFIFLHVTITGFAREPFCPSQNEPHPLTPEPRAKEGHAPVYSEPP